MFYKGRPTRKKKGNTLFLKEATFLTKVSGVVYFYASPDYVHKGHVYLNT